MAMFHEQSTRGTKVELDEANQSFVAEPVDAPDVRHEPPVTRKHANALGPFRSQTIHVPHPALARRDEQA